MSRAPAKALFFSLPAQGHVNPSLPLVRELVGRGDEVIYYATGRFTGQVDSTGARYRSYRDAFLADLSQVSAQTDELSWLLMRTSARVLGAELDSCRQERPDYIVTDSLAPWGHWLGAILKVPVVTSVSTFAFNRHVLAFGLAHGVRPKSGRRVLAKLRHIGKAFLLHRRLCRTHGVKGPGVLDSVMGHSDLNIVYTSRHFQPCAETFNEQFQFVGPMTSRAETATFPWGQVQGRRVVYVSLGTLFNADVAFYRMCFEASAGEDYQVILSTGPNVPLEALGPVPPNFIVASHVPQLAVLQRVQAVVTHGGMNSVSESLANGVPVVVIPQMGEQAIVGRRVAHLGVGLCLTKEAVTAETLRASVRQVLDDERFPTQVAVVRQSFLGAGGVARAADAIEAFTGRARGERVS